MARCLRILSAAFAAIAGATSCAVDEACSDTWLLQTKLAVGPEPAVPSLGEAAFQQYEDMLNEGLASVGLSVDDLDDFTDGAISKIRTRMASKQETTMQAKLDLFERLLRETMDGFLKPWSSVRDQVEDFADKAEASVGSMTQGAEAGLRDMGETLTGSLRGAVGLADQVEAQIKEAANSVVGISKKMQSGVVGAVDRAMGAVSGAMASVNDMVRKLNEGLSSATAGGDAHLVGLAAKSSHLASQMSAIQAMSSHVLRRLQGAAARLLEGLVEDFGH